MALYQPNYFYPYYGYQQQSIVQQPQLQPQTPSLYGKIVDSIETAKAQEVPIGQTGIYPKADMSAIFCKSWNSDGSTRIDEYQRIVSQVEQKTENIVLNDIYTSIKNLEEKIDAIKTSTTYPINKRKKIVEVDENE